MDRAPAVDGAAAERAPQAGGGDTSLTERGRGDSDSLARAGGAHAEIGEPEGAPESIAGVWLREHAGVAGPLLAERGPVGALRLGLDLRIVDADERIAAVLGLRREALVGRPITELVHPADAEAAAVLRRQLVAGDRRSFGLEVRYLRPDGGHLWVHQTTTAEHDDRGGAAGFVDVVEDISERRAAEERLRFASEQARLGIVILQDDRVCFANRAAAAVTGRSVDELLRLTTSGYAELVHPEDRGVLLGQARRRRDDAIATTSHYRYRLFEGDGRTRWIDQRSRTISHHGRPADLLTLTDITDLKVAESERSREYDTLLETSAEAIHVLDAEGVLREHNQAFLDHLGYSAEEAAELRVEDWDGRWSRDELRALLADCLAEPHRLETRHRRKDGSVVDVEVNCTAMNVGGERLIHASARDISQRKARDAELSRLWQTVERAPVPLMVTDRAGLIEYTNAAFSRATGYTADECRGQNPRFLQSGKTPPQVYPLLWSTILGGRPWEGELHNRRKSGEDLVEEEHISPLTDAAGDVTHFMAVRVDVTARWEAQRQLADLATELERRVAERTAELELASRAKDDFLATMSHELRTPLNGVLGLCEALRDGVYGEPNEKQVRALVRIDECGRHLLDLINDILDISKADAGMMALEIAPVAVEEVCRASLRLVQATADRKRHKLTLALTDVPPTLLADRRRLKQVLVNLLGNAIKFTPEGGQVSLHVGPAGAGPGDELRFDVRDSGIGIAEDRIPLLFRRFVQLDHSLNRRYTGTGLGLVLAQRFVSLHGGRVEVESTIGVGSRFSVFLPTAGPPTPGPRPAP